MKASILLIVIAALVFSTIEISIKSIGLNIDIFQLIFIRFFIGGVVLLPFAIKEFRKRSIDFNKSDIVYFIIMGITNIIISNTFLQFAIAHIQASSVAVIVCTNPMFTIFFAHFITDEKANRKKIMGSIISIIGLIFIMNPFIMNNINDLKGIVWALGSAISFGLYTAIGKRKINKFGGIIQTSASFMMGSIILLMMLIIFNKPIIMGVGANNILILLYISIFATGLGYLAYFMAMERTNAYFASIAFFLKPVFAPIFAVLFLKEIVQWHVIVGIVFILLGSMISLRISPKFKPVASNS